jgi:hypothetical protein
MAFFTHLRRLHRDYENPPDQGNQTHNRKESIGIVARELRYGLCAGFPRAPAQTAMIQHLQTVSNRRTMDNSPPQYPGRIE